MRARTDVARRTSLTRAPKNIFAGVSDQTPKTRVYRQTTRRSLVDPSSPGWLHRSRTAGRSSSCRGYAMHTQNFAKALLISALLLTCAATASADPIVCNPKITIAPPESESAGSGWFSRLFSSEQEPQPFSGTIMGDPDPTCSLASDSRSFAAEPRRPANRRSSLN